MDAQGILAKLRENEAALRERGVTHAALFGSRVRGDDRPGSDTDIHDRNRSRCAHHRFRLRRDPKEYIAALFDGPVDVVSRDSLKPYIRPAASADAVYAF